MNKPNGISDKVWEDAQAATGMYFHSGSYELISHSVALAISKAIEDEREACADLAMTGVEYFNRRQDEKTAKVGAWVNPFEIAQAIRSRSKGEE